MKHWSFLFSYLVAPKGAVCLFVCFSFSGAARVCSASWTECNTHLRRGNCRAVFLACKRIRFLVTASPLFLFSSTYSTTFFSSSGHWHFLPRSAHLVFGRDFMLSIFLLQSRTNFSSMPNFRLAAELLELSDANLTTCNLKLAEYFIRFTFDNIPLHVTQAKKTNREVRHLALPVLFSQLELIYT